MVISRRDYFAGLAMQSFLTLRGHTDEFTSKEAMGEIAEKSVELADFMLNEADDSLVYSEGHPLADLYYSRGEDAMDLHKDEK